MKLDTKHLKGNLTDGQTMIYRCAIGTFIYGKRDIVNEGFCSENRFVLLEMPDSCSYLTEQTVCQ